MKRRRSSRTPRPIATSSSHPPPMKRRRISVAFRTIIEANATTGHEIDWIVNDLLNDDKKFKNEEDDDDDTSSSFLFHNDQYYNYKLSQPKSPYNSNIREGLVHLTCANLETAKTRERLS